MKLIEYFRLEKRAQLACKKKQWGQNFTLVVPIYKETKALSFAKFYYDQINCKPLWVLDSKVISRKSEVENIVGEPVLIYENDHLYLEEYYSRFADLSPTDWILRVDCDELPSVDLLDYCAVAASSSKLSSFGIERHELALTNGKLSQLKFARFACCQWRFFNRTRVKFLPKVHTPGFKVQALRSMRIPPHRSLFHFDRVFNSQSDRLKKSANYMQEGQLPETAQWYERVPAPDQFIPFNDEYINNFFNHWENGLAHSEEATSRNLYSVSSAITLK